MKISKQLVTVAASLVLIVQSGGFARAGGAQSGDGLAACPSSPNCVSSQAVDEARRAEPLRYTGDEAGARNRLLTALRGMAGAEVVPAEGERMNAVFRSAVFGFVDDVTFLFDPAGEIQIRSASRTGYYDFGANRRRVEAIRAAFQAAGPAKP